MQDVSIVNRERQEHFSMPQHHLHDDCELYYLLEGEREYSVREESHILQAGGLVYVNGRILHRTLPGGGQGVERFLLNFRPELLARLQSAFADIDLAPLTTSKSIVLQLAGKDRDAFETQMDSLLERIKKREEDFAQLCVAELLLFVSNQAKKQGVVQAHDVKDTKLARFHEIAEYMSACHYQVSLDELSAYFGLSKYYICHLFKEVSGMTLQSYANKQKTYKAGDLLMLTDTALPHIATQAGFDSLTQFSRVFKAQTGYSPTAYRRRHAQPQNREEG